MRMLPALWTIGLCCAPLFGAVFGMHPGDALTLLCADMIVVAVLNGTRHVAAASRPDASPLVLWPFIAFVITGVVGVMAMWLDPFNTDVGIGEMLSQSPVGSAMLLMAWGRLLQHAFFLATPAARETPQLVFNPLIVIASLLWVLRPGTIPIFAALVLLCIGNAAFELLTRTDPREGTWLSRANRRLARGD